MPSSPAAPPSRASLVDLYTARRAAALTSARQLDDQSRRYSRVRLAVVGLAVAALFGATAGTYLSGTQAVIVIGAAAVVFVIVAVRHERVEHQRQRAVAEGQLHAESLARLRREWDALPIPPLSPTSATATDLDLEGRASLRQLLWRTATPGGAACLTAWVQRASEAPTDVTERQEAIRDLVPRFEHRFDLLTTGLAGRGLRDASAEALHRWVDGPPSPLRHRLVALAMAVIPAGLVLLTMLEVAGYRVAGGWLALPAVAWGVRALLGRHVRRALDGADALSGEVRQYAGLFGRWECVDVSAPCLVTRQTVLSEGRASASVALRRLGRLIDLADLRYSHLPHVLVHSLTGWDLHVAAALERWRTTSGARVARWFEVLAELDALAAMAGLAHDEPEWTYPTLAPQADVLAADGLAHPLIAADLRVGNSVSIGPPGTVLTITGSNMSGKSTLLRAIGLNVVLAQMGGPVCASRLHLPPLRLATSIRIADSLADGVSYFMSALLRIKEIVVAAEQPRDGTGPRVLYLMDEVLQGTNSEERQVAVRHIVRHLVRCDALGALTTHDLRLVEAPEFVAHARHVHFTEHITESGAGPAMTFDYTLRPGPATSRNALALVRLVGLGDPAGPPA